MLGHAMLADESGAMWLSVHCKVALATLMAMLPHWHCLLHCKQTVGTQPDAFDRHGCKLMNTAAMLKSYSRHSEQFANLQNSWLTQRKA